ncbi:MAG: CDP-alcohol phosphatidyltransferase family protein [Caldimicrobium sp.]|nr:CDP-alcohol phosphatidyltransferase family protein [Caldimicrobium sp.]MDW8094436.1 CDP-alcohol phosphatidyltransferase family protein [Caldimicrobium sp.]
MSLKREVVAIPNILSLYRLFISFIIPVLWIYEFSSKLIYVLLITGILSDTLDGNLARLLNQKTSLGKILDPLADKVFINMLFFLFYWEGKIEGTLFTVIIVRDILILSGGLYLLLRKLDLRYLNPSFLGKTSTVFQLLTLGFLFTDAYLFRLSGSFMKLLLTTTLFFTTASGFHYLLIFFRLSQYKAISKF